MSALPPLAGAVLAGGVKATLACPTPAVAVTFVGAFGTVAGITGADHADAGPDPIAFVAVTLN